MAEIRAAFGPFEYLAFVELTTGRRTPGHRPHLHLLARGNMPPKGWLSDRWSFHTKGSWRVDLQPLRSPAWAADYVVGYTVGQKKKAQQLHLVHWPGPRVRYSRSFFAQPVSAILRTLQGSNPTPRDWEWAADGSWLDAVPLALAGNDADCHQLNGYFASSNLNSTLDEINKATQE